MFKRRHPLYALAVFALLLAPFAMLTRPALAASTYTVTSNLDTVGSCAAGSQNCTLRQAIIEANGDQQPSQITFDFPGTDQITITPSSTLPQIDKPDTTITGQININNFKPRIIINGAGNLSYGLAVSGAANNTKIEKLIFTGFSGTGSSPFGAAIYINGVANTTILSTYIGNVPDLPYDASHANRIGVYISGGSNTTIGGAGPTDRNVIGGNTSDGILFSTTDGGTVFNNYIGVLPGAVQSSLMPNKGNGVQIENSRNVTVGGTPVNVIAANTFNGVLVTGSNAISNTISLNNIGTDENGATHGGLNFGNGFDGVRVENAARATALTGAGSATATLRISNNVGYGVRVMTGARDTTISGAVIGLNATGARFDNQSGGVALLDDSTGTTVGPGNYISGNASAGIVLKLTSGSFTAVSNTTITGNYIGLGTSLNTTVANTGGGVQVLGGAQHTTISNNTISGNTGFGVQLSATKTVTITGNFIGLNTTRDGKAANTGPGIDVQAGSTGTRIGAPGAGNYIAGNDAEGVKIDGVGTLNTTVENNVIGLVNTLANGSGTYTASQGNGASGILVSGGATSTTISANRIAGHTAAAGISLSGVTTATLSLNDIGYVTGVTPASRPNATGIALNNVAAVDVLTNTLKYNTNSGIAVGGVSERVKVRANTLESNSNYGVLVSSPAQRVTIQSNYMKLNTLGGVSLAGTTKGLVAETDTATSPNHGIDPPIYDTVNDPTFASPLRFMVDQYGYFEGYVYTDTLRASSCRSSAEGACQIQFFAPAADETVTVGGQGFTPYQVKPTGSATAVDFVSTDVEGSGRFSGQLVLGGAQLPKQLIFAATDGLGNSSEFGVLTVNPKIRVAYVDSPNGQKNAKPGDTITYTLSLVNEGTIRLSNVRALTSGPSLWTVNPPNGIQTPLVIDDHRSAPFTVTMTLPTGTDPRVRAGTQDFTSLYAIVSGNIQTLTPSQIMTTTVLASPIISADSLTKWGSAQPTKTVTHTHRFANSGNVTVTLDLDAKTIDPAASGYVWNTALSASSLEIPPDQSRNVDVVVTVPNGAPTVNAATGQPFIVTTVLTGTGRAPYNTVSSVVSGTVGVDLVSSVRMGGSGWTEEASSFATVSFNHSVTNTSNGPATFCLSWRSNSGSSVLSFTSQNDVVIDKNRCFRLDMSTGAKPILRFEALIQVTGKLLPQDVDRVEIFLTDTNGQKIANSTVFDNIEITVSPLLPRIWLPMVNSVRSL